MFGFKKKSKTKKIVKQSSDISNLNLRDLAMWLGHKSEGYARNYVAYSYNDFDRATKTTSPLNDAINKILDHLIGIEPKIEILKKQSKEYLQNSKFLDLLKKPNSYTNYSNFIKELGSSFLTFGNAYYIVGFVDGVPSALTAVSQLHVYIDLNVNDGYPNKYTVNQIDYKRTIDNGIVKFIYKDNDTGNYYQIIHVKNFCANNNYSGESKISPLMDDVILFNYAYLFNHSVLKNGGRISGIFTQQDGVILSDEDIAYFEKQWRDLYAGASNAGNSPILPPGFDYKQISVNPKDMDFSELIKETTKNIYNAFNIPLALVGDSSLSLANMETAMGHFYKSAVIPLINTLFLSFDSEILPYFESDKSAKITYNPWNVPALIPELMDGLKKASDLGVVSINEQRQKLGLPPIVNGDDVLVQSSLIPIGDVDTQDGDE